MKNIIDRIDPRNYTDEELIELAKELERLKTIDIRNVDPENLVEISTIYPDMSLDYIPRLIDYVKKVRNPYCYKMGEVIVKTSFAGERSINDCLKDALFGGSI